MGYIGADPALNESVTAAQIVDGTIVAADVASNAITNAKMADDAGLIPIVACPVLNDLPYLSLNPPGFSGTESTGLPDITSSKVDSFGF